MTDFQIHPGAPARRKVEGQFANDLSEAIELIYPMETDDARLVWYETSLPLNYKYDISVLIEDIVEMLEKSLESDVGRVDVNFASNTFNANWELEIRGDSIQVKARWNSVVGNCEARLNGHSILLIERSHFFNQWLGILRRVVGDTESARLRLGDPDLLNRARELLPRPAQPVR